MATPPDPTGRAPDIGALISRLGLALTALLLSVLYGYYRRLPRVTGILLSIFTLGAGTFLYATLDAFSFSFIKLSVLMLRRLIAPKVFSLNDWTANVTLVCTPPEASFSAMAVIRSWVFLVQLIAMKRGKPWVLPALARRSERSRSRS